MNNKYFAKIVSIKDDVSVVINKGSSSGVKIGDKFLIVGLGEIIIDPDTDEELGALEIVKGKVVVEHLQEKMATLKSCEWTTNKDKIEIKKVTTESTSIAAPRGILGIFGSQEPQRVTTESTIPGEKYLSPLDSVEKGDFVIKI